MTDTDKLERAVELLKRTVAVLEQGTDAQLLYDDVEEFLKSLTPSTALPGKGTP